MFTGMKPEHQRALKISINMQIQRDEIRKVGVLSGLAKSPLCELSCLLLYIELVEAAFLLTFSCPCCKMLRPSATGSMLLLMQIEVSLLQVSSN